MKESTYSKKLIAGGKTYFFDVRETESKEKYLQITESRLQNGERIRNNITIFGNHFKEFCKDLDELSEKLK